MSKQSGILLLIHQVLIISPVHVVRAFLSTKVIETFFLDSVSASPILLILSVTLNQQVESWFMYHCNYKELPVLYKDMLNSNFDPTESSLIPPVSLYPLVSDTEYTGWGPSLRVCISPNIYI